MKWPKSRNSKKRRSSSGSLGTEPGCRSASSETIRGEAEPTWCTCSSALGRWAMKSAVTEVGGTRRSSQALLELRDQVLRDVFLGASVLEHLAVEQHRGRARDPGGCRRLGSLADPCLPGVVDDGMAHGSVLSPGLDRQVGEL